MIITTVLYVAVILVSLLLIALILVQPSKSGGLGAAFGGVGESVFGAQVGSHLTKLTVVLTSIFFFLTLVLAILISHGAGSSLTGPVNSSLEKIANQEAAQASVPAAGANSAAPDKAAK